MSDRQTPGVPGSIGQSVSSRETVAPSGLSDSVPMSSGPFAQLPVEFGRFRVLKLLGHGAMGTVYLAFDPELGKEVALKIPKADLAQDAVLWERFQREARAVGDLNHPNICGMYEVGQIGATHFISMEYIDGRPLSDFISDGLPQRKVVGVIRKLASGMAHAHERGIVHRDLKPANVMIDAKGEPKLMDFGLARRLDTPSDVRATQSGMIVGSPAYMSPEQARAEHDKISPRTDVYGLGVLFFEMLTGLLPFRGQMVVVLGQIATQLPPRPTSLRADVDPKLETLCLKMLAKKQQDRPQSMTEVVQILTDWSKSDSVSAASSDPNMMTIAKEEPLVPVKPAAAKAEKTDPVETQRQRVKDLLTKHQYAAAIELLDKIVNLKDARFEKLVAWGRERLPEVRATEQKMREASAPLCATGEKLLKRCDYTEAVTVLSSVPVQYRSTELREMLRQANDLKEECDQLEQDIAEAIQQGDTETLPALVKRLLKLKPGSKAVKQLAADLNSFGAKKVIALRKGQRRFLDTNERLFEPTHIVAAVAGIAALFAAVYFGVVMYVQNTDGTLVVDVEGNGLAVVVNEVGVTVRDGKKEFRIKSTDQRTLSVQQDGTTVEGSSRVVKLDKGERRTITVRLVDGRVQFTENNQEKLVELPRAMTQVPDWLIQDAPFDVKQFWISVPSDQNAAPLYLDALYEFSPLMEVCFPHDVRAQRTPMVKARYKRSHQLQLDWDAYPQPKRNPVERDAVLQEHAVAFQKLAEAQKRSRCVFDFGWDVPSMAPPLHAARDAFRVAKMQVERDIERGDFDAVVSLTRSMLRLSRDLRPRAPLIFQSVVDSLDEVICAGFVIPALKSPKLKIGQCDELLRLLVQHEAGLRTADPPLARLQGDYLFKRMLLHDVQQQTGEFAESRFKQAFGTSNETRGAALMSALNIDGSMAAMFGTQPMTPGFEKLLDVVLRGMKPTDFDPNVAYLKEKYQTLAKSIGLPFAARAATFKAWNEKYLKEIQSQLAEGVPTNTPPEQAEAVALANIEKKGLRGPFLALLPSKFENDFGTIGTEINGNATAKTRMQATGALIALRRWYGTHADPPPDIATLYREAGFTDVPHDFFTDGPLQMITFQTNSPPIQYSYAKRPDEPVTFLAGETVIYSVGPDGVDDRVAKVWSYHPNGTGDWPFHLRMSQNQFLPGAGELVKASRLSPPVVPGIRTSEKGGHLWRYTFSKPKGNWTTGGSETDQENQTWKIGRSGFGSRANGMLNGFQNATDWSTDDIWLRTIVELPDSISDARVTWRIFHDEDIEVFVNGVEAVTKKSWTLNFVTVVEEATKLRPGRNVIAVHCHGSALPAAVDVGFSWEPRQISGLKSTSPEEIKWIDPLPVTETRATAPMGTNSGPAQISLPNGPAASATAVSTIPVAPSKPIEAPQRFDGKIYFDQPPVNTSLIAGDSATIEMKIRREGQRDAVVIRLEDLPPGFQCRPATLAADQSAGKIGVLVKPSCVPGRYQFLLVAECRGVRAERISTITVTPRTNSKPLEISMGNIQASVLKPTPRLNAWVTGGVFAKIDITGDIHFPQINETTYVFELDLKVAGTDSILFRLDEGGKAAELVVQYDPKKKKVLTQLYRCDGGNYWPGPAVELPSDERTYLKVLVVERRQWLFSDDKLIDDCDAPKLRPSLQIRCGSKANATIYRCGFRRPTEEELRSIGIGS